ncbi:MAG: hypothetical protein E7044_10425 [Lentisphaerae bacterium]|nr:hypothetical protein [Lentisphaerota bacterium]
MLSSKRRSIGTGSIKLQGEIGSRMNRFCFERAQSEEAWKTSCKEAADAFINKWDDSSGLIGYWQGEFWGKWILSAVDVCEYTGDEKLKNFIRKSIYDIISLQEPDGYVGTYRNPNFLLSGRPDVIFRIKDWHCDHNWNIWSRKYTLWAFVEGARLLDDPVIIESAVRLMDQTIATFDYVHLKIWETGTFSGLPSCSIMKPLLLLYKKTGKQKYLDFALEIADFWDSNDPRIMPRLIRNAVSGVPVSRWYNLYNDGIWTKSYEMMSCCEGLMELYNITGTEKYLNAVKGLWDLIDRDEINVFYGLGFNDHLTGGKDYPNAITEPCDNIHYMRLCHDLFCVTGDVKYINRLEQNFLNAFLAGVTEDGKWGARAIRASRRHFISGGQCEMQYNHCCVNNMARGFVTAAKCAVMTDEENLYINFFTPFEAEAEIAGEKVKITADGSYLTDGNVSLNIKRSSNWNGKIYVRLPEWAVGTTAIINQKDVYISLSCYYQLELAPEQTECNIKFAPVPVLGNTGDFVLPDKNDQWHYHRWHNCEIPPELMISTPHNYLRYGPLTLARSIRLGTDANELFSDEQINAKNCTLKAVDVPGTVVAFEAAVDTPAGVVNTRFCDYASAGNWQSEDTDIFNIYF